MARTNEAPMEPSRLRELAMQADRQGRCRFTPFLTPPEVEQALAAAKHERVTAEVFGGYEDAERRMVRFSADMDEQEPFPIEAIEIRWPHQDAPQHRDLLGAVMGLGVKRGCIGDIVLQGERAFLFAESAMAQTIVGGLLEAGRTRLSVSLAEELPELAPAEGEDVRFTVQSARLDAMTADGFHLSRGRAAELIEGGAVKLRHQQTLRSDARVNEGDAISVRGFGRLQIDEIGQPTRKGRLPVSARRFGVRP